MGYNGQSIQFRNFAGGLVTNKTKIGLALNEALEADNIIILSGGQGITNARGNTAFNSSAMASGAAVTGLYYFQQADQDYWLMAVCGTSIFKSDLLDGTMDDITGAVSITTGQNNIWDMITFDDAVIGFGGAPNAPWTWPGTGNAAALGGSPPTADFAFTYNNRVFAGISSTSTMYWSIVGNAADWTGAGSGSAVVGSLDDNQLLIGAAPLTTDQALLFKQNSVYTMATRNLVSSAFPIFPLHNNVGAAGKHAIVNINGEVYFITPQARMMSTNGTRLQEYPDTIDNEWDELNFDRLKYIQGVQYHGIDHDWLIWMVSTGSNTTNDTALIWDLRNRCWLKRSQAFGANIAAKILDGTLYTGHYDGKIYKQDVPATYTVASESNEAISWVWRTGWLTGTFMKTLRPNWINIAFQQAATGEISVKVGFDFTEDEYTNTISIVGGTAQWDVAEWDVDEWGGTSDIFRRSRLTGRGNTVNFSLSGNDSVQYVIQGFEISGYMETAQKGMEAS